jgi:DNA repair protein RecO (recombination protein O)
MILQHLTDAELPEPTVLLAQMQSEEASQRTIDQLWQSVEQALRAYAQYYFDRPIRSATLIDACFATADSA